MSDFDSLMAAKNRVEEVKQELLRQEPVNVNDVSNLIKRKAREENESSDKKVKLETAAEASAKDSHETVESVTGAHETVETVETVTGADSQTIKQETQIPALQVEESPLNETADVPVESVDATVGGSLNPRVDSEQEKILPHTI